MFNGEQRERVRERLIVLARNDPDIAAAAHVGSYVAGALDPWSDIDLSLGVRGPLSAAMDRWTAWLCDEFAAVHHWDLPFGPTIYRVYLLPNWLELDISFTPEGDFRPGGPDWQTVFGAVAPGERAATSRQPDNLAGLCWHHIFHAAASVARGKPWQAEWLLSEARHHILGLACRREGLVESFGKGTDGLPLEVRQGLEATLVASTSTPELRRSISATADALLDELDASDPVLAGSLRPMLDELTSIEASG